MSLMSLFRPLTPAELVQWTLRIYVRHWPWWVALAAVAVLPPTLLSTAVTASLPEAVDPALLDQWLQPLDPLDPNGPFADPATQAQLQQMMGQLVQNSLVMLGVAALTVLSQAVVLGGPGAVVAAACFHDQPITLGQAVRQAIGERGGALLGGHLAVGALLVALLLVSAMGIVLCVGLLGLGLLAYAFLAWVPLLAPVLALERGPLPALLMRAWHFGKRRVWLLLAAVAALWVLRLALSIPLDLVGGLLVGLVAQDPAAAMLVVGQVIFIAVQALVLPLGAIFYTLLYEDSKLRFDPLRAGLDAPFTVEVDAPRQPFLTTADLPNIIGVSLVGLGMLFGLYMLAAIMMLDL